MQATTVRDLGAHVRSARRAQEMTQAELAERLNVGRDWVVRLEQGQPRLEAQKVLDALVVLGVLLDVRQPETQETAAGARAAKKAASASAKTSVKKSPHTTVTTTKHGGAAKSAAGSALARGRASKSTAKKAAAKSAKSGRYVAKSHASRPSAIKDSKDPFEALFANRKGRR